MKVTFLFILLGLSFSVFATDNCEQVVEGYEDNSEMYVVCSALPLMSIAEKNQQMETIMGQYEGEPDKIVDYGDGTCDNLATVSQGDLVEEIEVNAKKRRKGFQIRG